MRKLGVVLAGVEPSGWRVYRRLVRVWLCFGVGFNNFATGREPMRAVVARIAQHLPDEGLRGAVRYFGSTGNFVVPTQLERGELAERLESATGREHALLTPEEVAAALDALEASSPPADITGVRWTPGLAFAVEGATRDRAWSPTAMLPSSAGSATPSSPLTSTTS